ncbi:MAG: DUF4270 domain-containing protein [Bacteroidaceae bacterium]|nr:DUF4270 domain-containing protein [Bacteroidaceae bacterium]
MKHIHLHVSILAALLALTACDDSTNSLGIFPETESISNSIAVYQATTCSTLLDSVVANSTTSYLGRIIDPETDTELNAEFAAQFATLEDYVLPARQLMVGDVDGEETRGVVQCDSAEVRLYFDSYHGTGDNPMKVCVYEMSKTNLFSEDSTYYTDVDLKQFSTGKLLASRVFTPLDYNLSESDLTSSTHSHNLRVMLDKDFGQNILEQYYQDPTNFKDSYHFIRNVLPGLYFTTNAGEGTMLNVYVGTVNVYFRYSNEAKDSVFTGVARFAATPEVIQSTHFNSDRNKLEQLVHTPSCTYLKTPAGICTEMTLPVDDVFAGSHCADSVSLASITLTRYNGEQVDGQLGIPKSLLMVRKKDAQAFFRKNRVSDGRTSYTTSFNSVYNTYAFQNIGRLLSYCRHEKQVEARAASISEDEWAKQNPDWNKVLLIPVSVTTTQDNSGNTIETSVNHDLSLSSVRLVGGSDKIDLQVIYSKFYGK